ncbi:MAG: response regulator [Nitrospirota bacterium]
MMRKPRVIIFDDEVFILNMLKEFFLLRGYEVLSYSDPTPICPIYGKGGDLCSIHDRCSDVMITDFRMPGVNGVELLEFQGRKGCKLDIRNKAVISGYIDDESRMRVRKLGCAFFQKPFNLHSLMEWLAGCEQRIDLSQQVATRRKEQRFESDREVVFRFPDSADIYTGIAVNTSPTGLCLKVPTPLQREQTINLHASPFHSCSNASVRWVTKIENGAYLAGVHCA